MQTLFSEVKKAVKEVSGKIHRGRQLCSPGGFCVRVEISNCCF